VGDTMGDRGDNRGAAGPNVGQYTILPLPIWYAVRHTHGGGVSEDTGGGGVQEEA